MGKVCGSVWGLVSCLLAEPIPLGSRSIGRGVNAPSHCLARRGRMVDMGTGGREGRGRAGESGGNLAESYALPYINFDKIALTVTGPALARCDGTGEGGDHKLFAVPIHHTVDQVGKGGGYGHWGMGGAGVQVESLHRIAGMHGRWGRAVFFGGMLCLRCLPGFAVLLDCAIRHRPGPDPRRHRHGRPWTRGGGDHGVFPCEKFSISKY